MESVSASPKDTTARREITRRQFLRGCAALAASGMLGACGGTQELSPPSRAPLFTPAEARTLPSPQPPGTPTPAPTAGPDELGLEQFLHLSSLLTGFDSLDPVLGSVYLQSLQARPDAPVRLRALFEKAGFDTAAPPQDVDDLGAVGFFDDEATRTLADTVIEYWYTGVYQKNGEPAVATYVDALVWDAMGYTKPRTICGPFAAFWEEPPPALP